MNKQEISPEPSADELAAVDLDAVAAIDLVDPDRALPLPADAPDGEELAKHMVEAYPAKVLRKRKKHIKVNDPDEIPEIEANVRSTPGIITTRGCCYAGCKGVVLGPITDVVHIVHGPIGCSYYAWMTRRNQADVPEGEQDFLKYCFSTDMTTNEIVFGGEKKLAKAIDEAFEIFHPKAIDVFSTCPVGLIGDDVHAVAREAQKKLGIPIFGFSCEGYKGVSQSAGHHIANNGLFKNVVGTEELPPEAKTNPFRINMLGEYNIGGDAFEIERILNECGIELVATFSGNAQLAELAHSQEANLNLIQCHRSINYMADMMETKFGIPWLKVNFIGAESTAKTLRKIGRYFDDPELTARIEVVIAEELAKVEPIREQVKARVEGRPVMIFVGGSRSHHYQSLFKDMGMPVVTAGYEFAHRDDYEGYRVADTIKIDADSRNIEELTVEADPERYNPRKSPEQLEELKKTVDMADYKGMMPEMPKGAMVVDDVSHIELEHLIEAYHPALVCSGIKDKYVVEKMGIPCKQLHNYDYGGPYAGFRGAVNFYEEIDRIVNTPVWNFVAAPWEKQSA
ncbi:nitrogenase molybdenum-iron protein alpha chain [Propionibacterium sp.]|uniref:nitrogenase molybdenum-iron protein alpha chain n=1 Tax=Propionibacterium sp. TaxID=1977903 RepID=UPI0039E97F97